MLKRTLPFAATAVAALLTAMPAAAVVTTYTATLTGPSESPPNNSPALGLAIVTFNDAALTVTVNEMFVGLTGGPVTGAHIHCCTTTALTGTAPVFLDFSGTGFPTTAYGNYDNTFTLSAANFATLSAGAAAGKAYVNIHNATYPSGEIRGFLVTPVPEPATYALMLGGVAAIGFVARRRRQR